MLDVGFKDMCVIGYEDFKDCNEKLTLSLLTFTVN